MSSLRLTVTTTSPPAGENLIALDNRLVNIWVSRSASARTRQAADAMSRRIDTWWIREGPVSIDRLFGSAAQIHGREIECHVAGCDFSDVENVVDQPHQPLRIVMGNGNETGRRPPVRDLRAPLASKPSEPEIEVSGVRNLAHIGDEVVHHAGQAPRLFFLSNSAWSRSTVRHCMT